VPSSAVRPCAGFVDREPGEVEVQPQQLADPAIVFDDERRAAQ
jgi:hypothetical protein